MKSYFLLKNKRHSYELLPHKNGKHTRVICKTARIDQDFDNEDVLPIIEDLPNIISAKQTFLKQRDKIMKFRVNQQEKETEEKKAREKGFDNVSEYLRTLALS